MKIKLAENFRAVFYAPFYATQALGFHAREGLEVELINSPAPAAAATALYDGSIDLTWGGPMRVMKARDDDPRSPLVCFCEVVGRDPFFLVARHGLSGFCLADLPGLRVATVSEVPTPWLCLQHDLREHGIAPGRIERTANRTMAENLEALRERTIDVAQMFEPYASSAVASGAGEIVYAASVRGPTAYTTYLATRSGIARNREAFAAMVRATRHILEWLAARDAETAGRELARAVTPYYPQVAPEILTAALRRYHAAGLWSHGTEVSRPGFARLAASLRSGGFISGLPVYEDCVALELG
jgi:NitT/TauT family transport system substrate-binding protein